ncbi:MAG: hypothetical protein D6822_01550, partial [Cyanobacteria bacterium J149]
MTKTPNIRPLSWFFLILCLGTLMACQNSQAQKQKQENSNPPETESRVIFNNATLEKSNEEGKT